MFFLGGVDVVTLHLTLILQLFWCLFKVGSTLETLEMIGRLLVFYLSSHFAKHDIWDI